MDTFFARALARGVLFLYAPDQDGWKAPWHLCGVEVCLGPVRTLESLPRSDARAGSNQSAGYQEEMAAPRGDRLQFEGTFQFDARR